MPCLVGRLSKVDNKATGLGTVQWSEHVMTRREDDDAGNGQPLTDFAL